jgi:hypothetical protein
VPSDILYFGIVWAVYVLSYNYSFRCLGILAKQEEAVYILAYDNIPVYMSRNSPRFGTEYMTHCFSQVVIVAENMYPRLWKLWCQFLCGTHVLNGVIIIPRFRGYTGTNSVHHLHICTYRYGWCYVYSDYSSHFTSF